MKVLMLSTDRAIFEDGSDSRRRHGEYAELFDELHIIVFSKKKAKQKLAENCFAYSTNSFSRFFYIPDAVRHATAMFGGETSKHSKQWVVTAQDPFETGLAGFFIARKFGAPLHLQIHTDFLSPQFAQNVVNTIRIHIAKFLLPRAQGVRVVSERIASSLKAGNTMLKTDPVVLPIFVDIAALHNAPVTIDLHKEYRQFDFIVFMASRLTEEKDIGTALCVARKLVVAHKTIGFIIAGDGHLRTSLAREAERLGIAQNVIFTGTFDSAKLASCYKTADIYLLTSRYEGYGRTLVESAAGACPIVTTNVGIVGDILHDRESVLVCPVADSKCIALRIEELMTNPQLRRNLALNAEEAIKQYSMSREEYLKSYKKILETCISNDKNT